MAYDKAKWHFDAADFPEGLALKQGGVHIAFFYQWMLENDFAGADLLAEMAEEIAAVKAGTYSALDLLFEFNDGVLLAEDFDLPGATFADHYYTSESSFAQNYGFYLADYEKLTLEHFSGVENSDYGIIFSVANYQKVKKILDRRYQEYLAFQAN